MKKRLVALLTAALLVLTLAACGGGASSSAAPASEAAPASSAAASEAAPEAASETGGESAAPSGDLSSLVIGMVLNDASADTYQTTYFNTAQSYAEELGFDLRLLDSAGDVTNQQNQVEDLISMDCDAIVVWPVNSEAAVAFVKSINEAGIPVMTANTNVVEEGREYLECHVGPSNVEEGRLTAEMMAEAIGNDAKIVHIDGQVGYSSAFERKEGMELGIEGTNIEVLDSQPGEANREKAQQIMENYLVRYPEGEIDAVFCYDDTTAVGAINALEAAGRTEVLVYAAACGDYATTDIIKSGQLSGVAMQSPIIDAQTAMDFAVRVAQGEKIAEFENYIETPVATPENIDTLGIEAW